MSASRLAVFSDVHANLEALEAVLADMDVRGVGERVCLGDIVGYAANPSQCLKRIRGLGCPVVQGNHDEAAANDCNLDDMMDVARRGIEFARLKLSPEQRTFLAELPLAISKKGRQFIHASLDEPGEWHYMLRESEARAHFQAQECPLCFCGHTHTPMVWHLNGSGEMSSWRGEGCVDLPAGGYTLVNVGSVGQPRDHRASACYAILDDLGRSVEFRRVEYEIAKTRRKILRAKLPRFAAQRLSLGR